MGSVNMIGTPDGTWNTPPDGGFLFDFIAVNQSS
jgi:hypothetical protein